MAATTSRMPEQYQPLQEEEVDDVPFTPLKALQNVGVQQADIKKLSEAGFATVEQILMTSKRKLTDVKGLSEMTNQVCADPGGSVFVQDAKKAVGGHVLAHLVDTRVSIRKGKGEQRVAKVLQHAFKGEAEATLQITPGGIDDAKD